MKDINIREIIDLATQDISDPDAELKKVYDWYNERKIMIIKGTVSIAAKAGRLDHIWPVQLQLS